MGEHDFSQVSITRDKRLVGSLNESHLYEQLVSSPDVKSQPVEAIMQPAFPFVDISTPLELLSTMITPGEPGGAGARLQDRQDLHHHQVGRDSRSLLIAVPADSNDVRDVARVEIYNGAHEKHLLRSRLHPGRGPRVSRAAGAGQAGRRDRRLGIRGGHRPGHRHTRRNLQAGWREAHRHLRLGADGRAGPDRDGQGHRHQFQFFAGRWRGTTSR